MKYAALIFVSIYMFIGCAPDPEGVSSDMIHNPASANGEVDADELPTMEFDDIVYDFGRITQGEKVTHYYHFTNTGKSELIITSAKGSCGCTVPSWPKEPIPPGGQGDIKVVFSSSGKDGQISKLITVVANTHPATNKLRITGEIIAPKIK